MADFREGAVAVVTGIGPGMGRSVALGLARHGVRVALAARRVERLDAVAAEVKDLGGEALIVPTDIADRDACHRLIDETVDRFDRLDVLVQNAHHEGDWSPVAEADPDSWRSIFDINLFGALHLVQRAVPVMADGGGGSIVLVNSGAALRFPPRMGAYAASKSALAAMARTMAQELGRSGIRVNGVFLGPVEGENLSRSGSEAARAMGVSLDEWLDQKAAEMPLGFIPSADQCAEAVVFLASQAAAAITGQHLSVNGGQWVT